MKENQRAQRTDNKNTWEHNTKQKDDLDIRTNDDQRRQILQTQASEY